MTTMLLSAEIRQTRDDLKSMRRLSFWAPGMSREFLIRRLNTLFELAELLEDDLQIARIKLGLEEDFPEEATILRFPTRIVLVPRTDDGGDAA